MAALTATGIAGGIRLSGSFPPDAAKLQVFEAASNSRGAVRLRPRMTRAAVAGAAVGATRPYGFAIPARRRIGPMVS